MAQARFARAAARLAVIARESGADLVHLNSPALAGAARFPCPVVAVAHGCVGTWWEAAETTPLPDGLAWQAAMMRDGLIAAEATVAPSAAFAAIVQRRYGLVSVPVAIHNGRTPNPVPTNAPAPADHAFTAGRLWDRVKNTPLLDEVARILPVPFLAAGPIRAPHGETAQVRHLRSLGTVAADRLAVELAQRPIFVSAASFEPFGLAVLEAAQAGCALLLSDIATFRELWDGAAMFVAGTAPHDWAAAIEAVRANPEHRMDAGPGSANSRRPIYAGRDRRGDDARLCRRPAAAGGRMRIVYFTHSLLSCWNHGNAHFLRGVLRDLVARGHDVAVYEPAGNWSLQNLLADAGDAGLEPFRRHYPELASTTIAADAALEPLVDEADLVIVHEWNDHALVAAIGRLRAAGGDFRLLFHDTHHRAVSAPDEMQAYDLSGYDGVLAFGEALSEVYRRWGWDGRVWTWHEAADTRLFHPPGVEGAREGLVWIGNWGDGERTLEIEQFLLAPAREAGLPLDIYGVRYPDEARAMLDRYGARYHGWAPNAQAPAIFARHLATVHVPRRYYATILPGIPTIRMFEALACGIPLVSAPWDDAETLFRPGEDFLVAADGEAMARHLNAIRDDPALRRSLIASGLETIRARHTCTHRADELLAVAASLHTGVPA